MQNIIDVRAFGSLQQAIKYEEVQLQGLKLDIELQVLELLKKLGISKEQVQLIMINHKAVTVNAVVRPGDRVALFPQEYPVFADWKDFR
jgi:molybdopterin converting factor small subunit